MKIPTSILNTRFFFFCRNRIVFCFFGILVFRYAGIWSHRAINTYQNTKIPKNQNTNTNHKKMNMSAGFLYSRCFEIVFVLCVFFMIVDVFLLTEKRCATSVQSFWRLYRAAIFAMCQKRGLLFWAKTLIFGPLRWL